MSSKTSFLRTSAFCVAGISGILLTACASGTAGSSDRYGHVYSYENNGTPCMTAANCTQPVRYGTHTAPAAPVYTAPRTENVIYADCSVMNGMNCPTTSYQPSPVYTAPVQTQTYTAPAPSYNSGISYGGAAAPCPAGTVAAGDGTCMQSSTTSTTSYSSSSYTTPSYSSTSTYSGETAACPAGTVAAGDGTCMQSSSSSYSSSSYGSSSYTTPSYSSTTSYSGETAPCPAGTTKAADGTCMQGGSSYSAPAIEIYNDASSSTYGGYTGSTGYTAYDYLPVRK